MIKDKNLRVLDYIDSKEILIQMGEEGSELSKAAIKFYRAIDMKNPTPVSINEAYENLVEEFGDVLNCIYAYFDDNAEKIWSFTVEADKIADEKRKRWIKRLKERDQF